MLPTVMLGRCVILLVLVVMSLLISFFQNVCRDKKNMLKSKEKDFPGQAVCVFPGFTINV